MFRYIRIKNFWRCTFYLLQLVPLELPKGYQERQYSAHYPSNPAMVGFSSFLFFFKSGLYPYLFLVSQFTQRKLSGEKEIYHGGNLDGLGGSGSGFGISLLAFVSLDWTKEITMHEVRGLIGS